jgi:2-amino-4-hydroxy-6-hydroxymethyldihydropteridine diphosphokinase
MTKQMRGMKTDRRAEGQAMHLYAIGLGSNRPLSSDMGPREIVTAAMVALDLPPLSVIARAPIIATRPLGPSLRSYANSAVIVVSPMEPLEMLDRLQMLEARFRRRRFRRWGDRTLDLDLLLWSGGRIETRRLTLPHASFRERGFVLDPLLRIARGWRDPNSGLTIAQLAARFAKPRARKESAGA